MKTLNAEKSALMLKRFENIWAEANQWRTHWMDISQYLCPERGIFDSTPNKTTSVDYQKIIDSTGDDALRTMAAGLASGMSSPGRPWFKMALTNKEMQKSKQVKLWLEDTEQRMYAVLDRSNFYGSCVQVYEETGAFGTGAMSIVEDIETVIRCRTFTVGEYGIGLDETNRIKSFARKVYKTVSQLVNEFGKDNVSPDVLRAYERSEDFWVLCCGLIEPNDDRLPGLVDSKNMPFRSVWWEDGKLKQGELSVSGYNEFPNMCPRWKTRNSSAVYGIGPGAKALGDIKMLQKQHVKKLYAVDKIVDPPTIRDANVDGETSFLPSGETFVSQTVSNGGVRPAYQIAINLNDVRLDIQETQNRIKRQFFYDLFLMFQNNDTRITATEAIKKFQEKAQVLGPALESFTDDFLDPALARVFSIMSRTGQIAEPPQELMNQDFKFEYTSILAQALKSEAVSSIEQFAQFAIAFAHSFPESGDVINTDESLKIIGDKMGIPVGMLRDDEEIAAIRGQRQQQTAYAQQQENINQTVDAAHKMSQTSLGNTTALNAVAGGEVTIPGVGGNA
jgi:hypothetical protein